ncbi:hypothetical protein MTBSS4_40032 [Magnetospirillum sp. SS-4]|nr:hypothetical protein MTBSS4_40032 [Magnetospirillum sp. SS-4]
MPAGRPGRRRQGLRGRRHRLHLAKLLRRRARAPDRRPSGHRPGRRLHRRRTDRPGPSRHPGALSLRHRRPSDRQRPRHREQWRRLADGPGRLYRRGAGRPSGFAVQPARNPGADRRMRRPRRPPRRGRAAGRPGRRPHHANAGGLTHAHHAAFHRNHPLRRHRRHRHVGHRRDSAQSGIHGAGQ